MSEARTGTSISPTLTTTETQSLPDPQTALRLYREGVEELWKLQSNKPISNAVPAHASILFESFFQHSKSRVRIFCRHLNAEVFGGVGVVQQAREALKRNVAIDVIVQEEPQESPFKGLLSLPGVRVHRAGDNIRDFNLNFAVADESAIRVEPDRNACKATAIMHAPEKAKELAHFFDKLIAFTVPVSPAV